VAEAEAAPLAGSVSRSITYTYDNLYRLTGASYNDGTSFTYTYDASGNRLTEVTTGGLSIAYVYDNANRLTSVDGMPLTWDNNGNLLSDGSSTYTYDKANRLKTVVQGSTTYAFTYSGLGDRLRQTVGGTPTTYVLDLDAGLTQVLADGTNFYLYGVDRIGEKQAGGWRYHVPDALGSVRQLVDASGVVSLARGYRPFGDPLTTVGSSATTYGFAGEQRDGTGLVFLRARFYAPSQGRFLTRDVWEGDPQSPMSYNQWLYAIGNPITRTDPRGERPIEDPCTGLSAAECTLDTYIHDEYLPNIETARWDAPPLVRWIGTNRVPFASDLEDWKGIPGAQFHVPGHTQRWANAEGQTVSRDDPDRLSWWGNLCGQVSLAAILGVPAREIVEAFQELHTQWKPWQTSHTDQLIKLVNEKYSISWHASRLSWDGRNPRDLHQIVASNGYIVPLVTIINGNSVRQGGVLGNGGINHWVVLYGLSREWQSSMNSPLNWARIFNPFTNETEFYPWALFRQSWYASDQLLTGFVVKENSRRDSMRE